MSKNSVAAKPPKAQTNRQGPDLTVMDRIKQLEKSYLNKVQPLVQRYYASLSSNFVGIEPRQEELVGLLTYPNSGTSWFLKYARVATGIHIHTMYSQEAEQANGCENRGVFMLQTANPAKSGRAPGPGEPAIVKSHVADYGEYPTGEIDLSNLDGLAENWARSLPPNAHRHIRLVRNPLDNLRARYHLYLKNHQDVPEDQVLPFRRYFKQDLKRYFLWHHHCNKLAETQPLLTVCYSDLLDNTRFEFTRALQFAGHAVDPKQVQKAYRQWPPKYQETNNLPVHLLHYSENDIDWIANQIRKWLER